MEPVNDRSNVDEERRSRLRDLAKKDFPGGKIPDPYTSAWLNVMDGAAMRDLPFIQATIRLMRGPMAPPNQCRRSRISGCFGTPGHRSARS